MQRNKFYESSTKVGHMVLCGNVWATSSIVNNVAFFRPKSPTLTFFCVRFFNRLFEDIMYKVFKKTFKKWSKVFKRTFFRASLSFFSIFLTLGIDHLTQGKHNGAT